MNNYFSVIDRLFEYITPAILASDFERKKLKLKLNLIANKYPETRPIIDTLIKEYLSDRQLIDQDKIVWLPDHYSQPEIAEINKVFGFSPNNKELTLNQVELGYQQNINLPKAKDYYYKLLWAHFQDNSVYSHPDLNHLTNLSDEVLYVEENKTRQ